MSKCHCCAGNTKKRCSLFRKCTHDAACCTCPLKNDSYLRKITTVSVTGESPAIPTRGPSSSGSTTRSNDGRAEATS